MAFKVASSFALLLHPTSADQMVHSCDQIMNGVASRSSSEIEVSALCRTSLPPQMCRQMRRSLGVYPWSASQIDSACTEWSGRAHARSLSVEDIQGALSDGVAKAQDLGGDIADKASDAVDGAQSTLSDGADKIQDIGNDMTGNGGGNLDLDKVAEQKKQTDAKIRSLMDVGDVKDALSDGVKKAQDLGDHIAGKASDAVDSAQDTLSDGADKIQNLGGNSDGAVDMDKVAEQKKKTSSQIRRMMGVEDLQDTLSDGVKKAQDVGSDIADKASDAVEGAQDTLSGQSDGSMDMDKVTEQKKEQTEKMQDTLADGADQVQDLGDGMADKANDAVDDAQSTLSDGVESITDAVQQKYKTRTMDAGVGSQIAASMSILLGAALGVGGVAMVVQRASRSRESRQPAAEE